KPTPDEVEEEELPAPWEAVAKSRAAEKPLGALEVAALESDPAGECRVVGERHLQLGMLGHPLDVLLRGCELALVQECERAEQEATTRQHVVAALQRLHVGAAVEVDRQIRSACDGERVPEGVERARACGAE